MKMPVCVLLELVIVMLALLHVLLQPPPHMPTPAHVSPTVIVPQAIVHHQTSALTPAQSAKAMDLTMMDVTVHKLVTVSQILVQHLISVLLPALVLVHIIMTVDAQVTLSVIQVSAPRHQTVANQLALPVRDQAHTV